MKQTSPKVKSIFWVLVIIFALLMLLVLCPFVRQAAGKTFAPLFFAASAAFVALGILLIVFTLKEKIEESLKKFLILTGASAVGFLASVLLHNFFYAMSILSESIHALSYLMGGLSAAFFIAAIFICPAGFLAGAIGAVLNLFRK